MCCSMGTQLLGCVLAFFGWIGAIVVCATPMWRVTAFVGTDIVTAKTVWEGIWMSCVVHSTGQMECSAYDSLLALSSDLRTVRALVLASVATGVVGIVMTIAGGRCTDFIAKETAKATVVVVAGVVFIVSGILCLVPVSWTASIIISNLYHPVQIDPQRRELGAAIYLGWAAAILLVLGGGLLCNTCPLPQEEDPEDREPTVQYIRTSGERTELDSNAAKTYT